MKKKWIALLLIIAIGATIIAVPLYQYPTIVYGSKMLEGNLVFDYVQMWWHKIVRRFFMQFGPAETAEPSPEQAEDYTTPQGTTSGEPQTIYDVISAMKANTPEYSSRIAALIEANGLPNKPAQADVYIIPEEIYLTFVWNQYNVMIYDGWIGDQECSEYVQVTITSDLVKELYENQYDTEASRNLVLQGEADGNLTYSIKRLNPDVFTLLIVLEFAATIISLLGWSLTLYSVIRTKK